MLYIHPFLATLTIILAFYVGILGWRSRVNGNSLIHASRGKILLIMLGIIWLMGLISVGIAKLDGVKPAGSGHFIFGTIILIGFLISAYLMLNHKEQKWVRIFHAIGNSFLLLFLIYQVLLGTNRLYKFALLSPVPQDPFIRNLLAIKFDLVSPPASAAPAQSYQWKTPSEGKAFSGNWQLDNDSILQSATDQRFPLLVFDAPIFGDFSYIAEFLIVSGQEDRYAGLAFRIVDENNYYVVRASASEQSVTFARFNNGSHQVLQTYLSQVGFNEWQKLQVLAKGEEFKIFLNDLFVGEIQNSGWRTGKVGLGTKADSITRFCNITAKTD